MGVICWNLGACTIVWARALWMCYNLFIRKP